MKDAIIIALCTVILGGAGFVAGMVTTKDEPAATVDTSKLSDASLKAKASAVVAPDSSSSAKAHNEMMYGGIGAVVGLLGGAGVSAMMGKKK
jgi:hypothetical protein